MWQFVGLDKERQSKAVAKAAITILANVSAVSIGIAFIGKSAWRRAMAKGTTSVGCGFSWRVEAYRKRRIGKGFLCLGQSLKRMVNAPVGRRSC